MGSAKRIKPRIPREMHSAVVTKERNLLRLIEPPIEYLDFPPGPVFILT